MERTQPSLSRLSSAEAIPCKIHGNQVICTLRKLRTIFDALLLCRAIAYALDALEPLTKHYVAPCSPLAER